MTEAGNDLRCSWAGTDPLNVAYHDEEWGRPQFDESHLFEMLTLEGAQAGLSWITILRKREGYRKLFVGFDPGRVAGFDKAMIDTLVLDASIVRHRGKIEATVNNARRILALWDEGESTVAGQIALQRMPRPMKSLAIDLVSPITAALVAP